MINKRNTPLKSVANLFDKRGHLTFITRGFEEPGQQAIEKLLSRSSMRRADWHSIARFVVAQDLRTPLNFLESIARFEKHLDEVLEKTVRKYEAMGPDRPGRIRCSRTSRRELLGRYPACFDRSDQQAGRAGDGSIRSKLGTQRVDGGNASSP